MQSLFSTRNLATGLLAGMLALLLFSLAGCAPVRQANAGVLKQPENFAPTLQGKLVPRRSATLSLSNGARVEHVFVSEGQEVSAGEVLLRLDGYEQLEAKLASADLEVILAQQEIDNLYQDANLALAQAKIDHAEAEKEQANAEDHFESLSRPLPNQIIEAARANMLLAERRMKQAQDDLEKAQRIFANKKHLIWSFLNINPSRFKLRITMLEGAVADAERRFQDSKDKYEDLLAYPDEIDFGLAQARLKQANSQLSETQRQIEELSAGPDPDLLETANARLRAAQANREAAQVDQRSLELVAPISGVVVAVEADQGAWIPAGMPAVILADLSEWQVESDELEEAVVPSIKPGQPVRMGFVSLPELALDGQVESVSQTYREDDGDIYYTIIIDPLHTDPRMRWGMTVSIELVGGQAAGDPAG